jgi:phosphatidylinositol alpha-1,6-mannosyltransferase
MRLLVLTIDYPPLGGGISRWTETLCRSLSSFHVQVLAHESPDPASEPPASSVELFRGPFFRRVPARWRLRDFALYVLYADRLCRRNKPSLILAAQASVPGVAAWIVGGLRGVPIAIAGHGEELERIARNPLRRTFIYFALRRAALVIANSLSTSRRLIALGARPGRLRRWAAIDPEGWGGPRRAICPAGTPPAILCVGRIVERKGQDQLLRAWPSIRRDYPDSVCWIVGSGPGEPALRAQLDESPEASAGVRLFGKVEDRVLREMYEKCALFALPSRSISGEEEGFGLVFLEAALFGKPSVAGRVGGVSDAVLHGRTGLLVDPENPLEIADAVSRLLRDRALRRRMGFAAWRRFHRRFALPVAASRLEGWLRDAATVPRRGRS